MATSCHEEQTLLPVLLIFLWQRACEIHIIVRKKKAQFQDFLSYVLGHELLYCSGFSTGFNVRIEPSTHSPNSFLPLPIHRKLKLNEKSCRNSFPCALHFIARTVQLYFLSNSPLCWFCTYSSSQSTRTTRFSWREDRCQGKPSFPIVEVVICADKYAHKIALREPYCSRDLCRITIP